MKKHKPTTPGRRGMTTVEYRGVLTASKPHKPLTKGRKRDVGRSSSGRISTRHKGGGHKRRWREIDFVYNKHDIPATIQSIEYDPNRSGFIGLAQYKDGEKRYVIVPKNTRVGSEFIVSEKASVKVGNRLPLKKVPAGTFVYNVELKPAAGARLARSAGSFAEIIASDSGYVQLKMPSGEIRKVIETAWASVGEVSNEEYKLRRIGKAGRSRWLGKRPTVRGSAMSAVDHPHGGGEGRAGRGHRRQRTKWGKPAGKGQKTRKPGKYSNALILERRKPKKRR